MRGFITFFRNILGYRRKTYRTTGFVFRHSVIAGRMFCSLRISKKKVVAHDLFWSLDTMKELKKSYKYSMRIICYLIILKELSLLLSTAANFLRFLRIRSAPNIFSCIRNKLMPKNDGKTDSVVYESNYFFNFLYSNCRNHFYGESKNLIRN